MRVFRLLLALTAVALVQGCKPKPAAPTGPARLLVFSKTAGYRHESIDSGKIVLMQLGAANGYVVDTTEDATKISEESLKQYAALVFLSPTGNLLNRTQEIALQRYIQAGGGYVGIHAASDAEYDWRWYGRLVGGYFISHPAIQEAKLRVMDAKDPSTAHLPAEWKRTDEWYNFKALVPDLHVLLTIDETSYTGGTNGATHPMAWYHEFDGGRAFYTELGHTKESYADSLFLKHVLGGIRYAVGERHALGLRQGHCAVPAGRLALPQGRADHGHAGRADGDGGAAQRRRADRAARRGSGALAREGQVGEAGRQGGCLHQEQERVECGGRAAGPDDRPGLRDEPLRVHVLQPRRHRREPAVTVRVRWRLAEDRQPEGGAGVLLAARDLLSHRRVAGLRAGHLLYISTGDNSTPFDEAKEKFPSHGFSPTDDRPGHEPYDARRSAANSNDLRGKILRIHIKPDGTYDIPAGNLFPPGTPNTRPEIFVMGNRNPYRVSVDQKSGWLYWGEVGPDAADDTLATRGPRGYDEVNQARVAGNYGWPLFVGNNYAYHQWNYATGASGPLYDAAAPKNESRNNTGVRDLPPAQPAFIWYPYGDSHDFPQVGKGGRTAMAGPIYHAELFANARETALPPYYDGKFFTYDWIRHWIMAVTLRPNGDFETMEPFAPRDSFSAPIDMEMGPDGRIYVLEYGKAWFAKNADAGLSMIEYRRPR